MGSKGDPGAIPFCKCPYTWVSRGSEKLFKRRLRLGFDTSVVNWLTDELDSRRIADALCQVYDIALPDLALAEVLATKSAKRTNALLTTCSRLITKGDCLVSRVDILTTAINEPASDPDVLYSRCVNSEGGFLVRWSPTHRMADDNPLLALGLEFLKKDWEELLREGGKSGRPNLRLEKPLFASWLKVRLRASGASWKRYTAVLDTYTNHNVAIPLTKKSTIALYEKSAPVRALIVAAEFAIHRELLYQEGRTRKKWAGRNDLLMAVYLPLFDIFITADVEQQNALKEVARFSGLRVAVESYSDLIAHIKRSTALKTEGE